MGYDFNSTQVSIERNVSENKELVLNYFSKLQSNITDSVLYTEEEGYGRETDAHITVLYGLIDRSDYIKVKDYLKSKLQFSIQINECSYFESEKYDVIFIKVISNDLVSIHNWIKENCKTELTFPEYTPHMTLAYVRKGYGKKLSDFINRSKNIEKIKFNVDSIEWSTTDGDKLKMPLKRKISFDDAMEVGDRLGIDFNVIDPSEFWKGMEVELEHGEMYPETDIIPNIKGHDNLEVVGQIAYRHILEVPNYYELLYKYVDQD